MEELLNKNLQKGETVLWRGKPANFKILEKTYTGFYAVLLCVFYGLTIFFLVYAFQKNGKLDMMTLIPVLVFGSIIPLSELNNAFKARPLGYFATDRRLIRINRDRVIPMEYDRIRECQFKKDADGKVSLLCGWKAVQTKPYLWRNYATSNVIEDEGEPCRAFILYAVNDPEGLKNVLKGRVEFTG